MPELVLTDKQREAAERLDFMGGCVNTRELRFDRPARTLTASNLANNHALMIRLRLQDGTLQRPTVAQAARLQTVPDWFTFAGVSSRQAFMAIGNGVPSALGRALRPQASPRHALAGRVPL